LRYIWLKNEKFRGEVLDKILLITEDDLKNLELSYGKYLKILGKLKSMKLSEKDELSMELELDPEVLSKINHTLGCNINTQTYFILENIIPEKEKSKYWKYIKSKVVKDIIKKIENHQISTHIVNNKFDLSGYVKKAMIFDYSKFKDAKSGLENNANSDIDLEQKLQTLSLYEKLFTIKDIILKIEDKMWYSPWIKVFIKQGLAEKIDFSKEEIKRLKYVLYFILAQNYSEYKSLYKFFDETENIYQKEVKFRKILNTISVFVLAILFYAVLYFYFDSEIYKTLFFIIVFMSTFALWYLKKFDFNFEDVPLWVKFALAG
jgi:hypothetical protein